MAQSNPTTNFNVQDFFSTQLASGITASDTTIPLVSAPTATEGFLVIESDSSTNREIIMYTSVSGNSVVCGSVDDRGIGGTTARAHSSGVSVKMNTVSDMFKALKSGKGWSDGVVTPNKLIASSGSTWVWQNSPNTTITNVTLGNGTLTYKYTQIGKTVFFKFRLVFGSSTSISDTPVIPLPVTAFNDTTLYPLGEVFFNDASTSNNEVGTTLLTSTTAMTVYRKIVSAAPGGVLRSSAINSTTPWTWTTSDSISTQGYYEAA